VRSYRLPGHAIAQLKEQIDLATVWATLQREGVVEKGQTIEETTFWRGSGCTQCGDEGYKGRMGIYEILEITPEISSLINSKAGADVLKKKAIEQGMVTMIEDGFIKTIKAVTTIEEVLRVTRD
jgi:type II secretory ATPase GspE/PulE/Tfp pilus assembly ATPase PilB-like protein